MFGGDESLVTAESPVQLLLSVHGLTWINTAHFCQLGALHSFTLVLMGHCGLYS